MAKRYKPTRERERNRADFEKYGHGRPVEHTLDAWAAGNAASELGTINPQRWSSETRMAIYRAREAVSAAQRALYLELWARWPRG